MNAQADIGVYGIGVMGRSIALNFADNGGYTVALFNRTQSKVDELLVSEDAVGLSLLGADSVERFVAALARPRRIMLMVPAGAMVDASLEVLVPLLEAGDIIIDGGNSYFKDTIRREGELKSKGIHFFGVGVSGGEEGARHGPSIMPGGSREAYELIREPLERIAAKFEGEPCCAHMGEDGAGHFVKMVHNGIEYADMQIIAEAYFLLKNYLGLDYPELAEVFREWNQRALGGFLLEITADILDKVDTVTSKPILEVILDRAGQKGTGKWTAQLALDLGVAAPTIAEAVFARCSSGNIEQRLAAAQIFPLVSEPFNGDKQEMLEAIYDTVLVSKIVAYAQGFEVLRVAGKEYNWDFDFAEISSIWRNGCILRSKMLSDIAGVYLDKPDISSMLLAPGFAELIKGCANNWRLVVAQAMQSGLPLPAISSALNYFAAFKTRRLWTDMIQAQRDYFGAHTFERVDREAGEFFHADW